MKVLSFLTLESCIRKATKMDLNFFEFSPHFISDANAFLPVYEVDQEKLGATILVPGIMYIAILKPFVRF